ncbi:MAG: glutamine-hydrolyzing GMP synthase [Chitinophagales bacterium]|nr:glutamine-hydrolyzing GMP synthase [Bacteroidota bacterium]
MDKIIILDSGSQYTQLIARRIRDFNVLAEIYPFHHIPEIDAHVKGVILSGSPFSVNDEAAPAIDFSRILGHLPLLGICYGAQLLAKTQGGKVARSAHREYGKALLTIHPSEDVLFENVAMQSQVWMSHADTITELPADTVLLASTDSIENAAYCFPHQAFPTYGLQFHPEVFHSLEGSKILQNFVLNICAAKPEWKPSTIIEETIHNLKEQIGDAQVVIGLSGGVDSSVAALLLHRAIGKQMHGIFINNGLLRLHEFEEVLAMYEHLGLNIKGVDASDLFLQKLAGETDPETKRKIIGNTFIEVFEHEASLIDNVQFLAQGTIYPDVIESISVLGPSAKIKSHHNVGGLPEKMHLKVVEPLRKLFKDEVRQIGELLELSAEMLHRHPFPGPGLAVRILGDITPEKVHLLQQADAIFINSLKKYHLYNEVWQAGVVLLPVYSVGVMGDERTYEQVVALRAVNSNDGMTAEWSRLPFEFLAEVSNKIINQISGINRVVYDISTKPPATIEWE